MRAGGAGVRGECLLGVIRSCRRWKAKKVKGRSIKGKRYYRKSCDKFVTHKK